MGDTYYRSYRIINNKPKWVITDEDGNIIRNPTKEQRKLAIIEDSYVHKKNKLKGRICCRCQNNKTYTYPDAFSGTIVLVTKISVQDIYVTIVGVGYNIILLKDILI